MQVVEGDVCRAASFGEVSGSRWADSRFGSGCDLLPGWPLLLRLSVVATGTHTFCPERFMIGQRLALVCLRPLLWRTTWVRSGSLATG